MKSDSVYYIHKDYQGNMESITSEQGQLLESISFDPWGRRRDANTWEYDVNIKPQHFDRGYTMHSLSRSCFGKHHDVFGLINMNGRMYDPWVGRMLSPDPFVQDPTNTQNSNRYTYALNNPLKYTDPSGYTYKPADWDSGMGRGGAISINYMGFDGFARNENMHHDLLTYNYNNSDGTWTNSLGQYVTPFQVFINHTWTQEEFNNFVEENSTNLPANTDLTTINISDGRIDFSTVDPLPSPILSDFPYEVSRHSVKLGVNSFDQNAGDVNDEPPEGYRFAPHDQVAEIMGTTQNEKDWVLSAAISTLGAFVKGTGKGSWGTGLFFAATAYWKDTYYDNMYIHYSENGTMDGVYYRDRFEISGDCVSWFRDIIYVNGQGNWIIQP